MSRNLKLSAALIAVFAVVIGAIALTSGGDDETTDAAGTTTAPAATTTAEPEAEAAAETKVVADDPRRLGKRGTGNVTFTEFLDFECESCRAAFPAIEELRKAYAGRVTFNLRYFPIPSHANAMNAAIAVEAAHQQGKLEEMYQRMYETQTEWGEQQTSKASVFRGFAKDLGLDMKQFDADVADPKTAARVERDAAAGRELGVQGTPTFFINEQMIQPESVDDIRNQIDAALEGQ